jgi:hypothetical protein
MHTLSPIQRTCLSTTSRHLSYHMSLLATSYRPSPVTAAAAIATLARSTPHRSTHPATTTTVLYTPLLLPHDSLTPVHPSDRTGNPPFLSGLSSCHDLLSPPSSSRPPPPSSQADERKQPPSPGPAAPQTLCTPGDPVPSSCGGGGGGGVSRRRGAVGPAATDRQQQRLSTTELR